MPDETLAARIYRAAHLTGTFKLRSGATSTYYFDKYRFESDPALLRDIALGMKELLPEGSDRLAGLELGGVPLATALSLETGIPSLIVRRRAKDYGTAKGVEGVFEHGPIVRDAGRLLWSNGAMRILGHGVDLVDTQRVGRLLEAHGQRFLDRCYTPAEQAYADGNPTRRLEHLAGR